MHMYTHLHLHVHTYTYFWGRVLRSVLRRGPSMGFTVKKGSEKGSQKGFWEGGFQKVPRTPRRARPLRRAPYLGCYTVFKDHGITSLDGQNRQSPIASVQQTRSTLARHSAVPCGTNVKRMNANRAIRIAAQWTQGLWGLISVFSREIWQPTNASDSNRSDNSRSRFCDNYRAISPTTGSQVIFISGIWQPSLAPLVPK